MKLTKEPKVEGPFQKRDMLCEPNCINFRENMMRKTVCFDNNLGCFDGKWVPETPEIIGTKMKLYTRQNK